jgi:hypothetical protein
VGDCGFGIQQTSSSMEQLSTMVRSNAGHATQARTLAGIASTKAGDGTVPHATRVNACGRSRSARHAYGYQDGYGHRFPTVCVERRDCVFRIRTL